MSNNNQYWLLVTEEDYAEFDHELRKRNIIPRAAHEVYARLIIVYIETNQETWNDILNGWGKKYAA